MLLLIDAGNTRIKWGITQLTTADSPALPAWLAAGSLAHADLPHLADELKPYAVTQILISNVAGATVRQLLESSLAIIAPGLAPDWFSSQPQLAGLRNAYLNPGQLGCDRFASAIAAHALYPGQDLIVATCGTATTVDAVSADGVFHGGMILPGLKLMAQSLARNTAQLPQVAESVSVEGIFADNTDQAIVSGCIAAQVGAIEHAVTAWRSSQKAEVSCIVSGGAAPYLLGRLGVQHRHMENLVLTGLYHAAKSSMNN
ncbi:type III pantothenate kinase [Undibacterium terreum]|uniref:Type III pantothenate kinase n=1 Tax=Undibacterium terreum TaxID=1224302 RepID=A0A916XS08_9BURK|nr:type III pantothenate kinase [Undibacterium terreum]GGD01275.1 type III pantothenate kinase [Undibacterium terreum]